jgi:hypothetical protein
MTDTWNEMRKVRCRFNKPLTVVCRFRSMCPEYTILLIALLSKICYDDPDFTGFFRVLSGFQYSRTRDWSCNYMKTKY